jgi:hypothetical protein
MSSPKNRGKESGDEKLFAPQKMRHRIKAAVEDMSHLLTRGYGARSTLLLVGNRHQLNVRQQKAVLGMSASDEQIAFRTGRSLPASELHGRDLVIDGFNALILLESLLSGAYVFKGVDGFYRDLSAVYGSYKKVQQTQRAVALIGDLHRELGIGKIVWYFDKPVSNSGKLKKLLEDFAAENGLSWEVFLTFQTDKDIVAEQKVAVSSDAWILDHAAENFNLIGYVSGKDDYPNIVRLF